MKKQIKPQKLKESDEDNKTKIRKKEKDLPLKLYHNQTKQDFLITQNMEVNRKKTDCAGDILFDGKTLGINDQEISRIQCQFKPFKKGYTISDKSSSNGTYIMLKEEYQTLAYQGMILEIGDFFLKVKKLSGKTINWILYQDEENEEESVEKVSNFKNMNKIKFGKNPGEKNDIEIKDSAILDVQGYFEKKADTIYVITCKDKNQYVF